MSQAYEPLPDHEEGMGTKAEAGVHPVVGVLIVVLVFVVIFVAAFLTRPHDEPQPLPPRCVQGTPA